jgi:crotonobetainyl-CoA:carnitine CoA-transferase CaiB-like acyl-CoA transferase
VAGVGDQPDWVLKCKGLADKTRYKAVGILREYQVSCAPVLSMQEIAYDTDLRSSGTVVGADQKERGMYLTIARMRATTWCAERSQSRHRRHTTHPHERPEFSGPTTRARGA